MSIAMIRLFFNESGTSPLMMRRARAFDDCRLADARIADEHRIIFRPARKHLHHAPNFVVASDDRIDFAAPRQLGQIAPVFFQRLKFAFWILIGHSLRTTHLLKPLHQLVPRDAEILQQFCRSERSRRLNASR